MSASLHLLIWVCVRIRHAFWNSQAIALVDNENKGEEVGVGKASSQDSYSGSEILGPLGGRVAAGGRSWAGAVMGGPNHLLYNGGWAAYY
jgi:hypothetical protein